jgi:hypothetical protein
VARPSQYPHNPFHVGYLFRGYAGSQLLRPARLLASPDGSDWYKRPATGGFYVQAFDGAVALTVAGYNYDIDWTPMSAGLTPAGMAASFAAPLPPIADRDCGREDFSVGPEAALILSLSLSNFSGAGAKLPASATAERSLRKPSNDWRATPRIRTQRRRAAIFLTHGSQRVEYVRRGFLARPPAHPGPTFGSKQGGRR